VGRLIDSLGHIIMIPDRPVFVLIGYISLYPPDKNLPLERPKMINMF